MSRVNAPDGSDFDPRSGSTPCAGATDAIEE
jgi:hypothetical protein